MNDAIDELKRPFARISPRCVLPIALSYSPSYCRRLLLSRDLLRRRPREPMISQRFRESRRSFAVISCRAARSAHSRFAENSGELCTIAAACYISLHIYISDSPSFSSADACATAITIIEEHHVRAAGIVRMNPARRVAEKLSRARARVFLRRYALALSVIMQPCHVYRRPLVRHGPDLT